MLKRIPVDQLRLGMYVDAIPGSWLRHGFWRTRFLVESADDLQRLRRSRVREIWIDTALGRDVADEQVLADMPQTGVEAVDPPPAMPLPGDPPPSRETVPSSRAPADSALRPLHQRPIAPRALEEELSNAREICRSATGAVRSMFEDVRLGRALEDAAVLQVVDEIAASVSRNADALVSLARIKTKDDYTYLHSVAVCAFMVSLARQLGQDESQARAAGIAGLMHDIGKIDVPLDILNKPSALTAEELGIVRRHPTLGWQRLKESATAFEATLQVCLWHHERIDGGGYPHGLAGDGIPEVARMAAVCDVYDAVTSDRPYKRAWDPGDALRRMDAWEGHFDRRILHAFVRTVGIYPVGTVVRLDDGATAVVLSQSGHGLLTPIVRLLDGDGASVRLDLSLPGAVRRITGRVEVDAAVDLGELFRHD